MSCCWGGGSSAWLISPAASQILKGAMVWIAQCGLEGWGVERTVLRVVMRTEIDAEGDWGRGQEGKA